MNYIKRLESESAELRESLTSIRAEVADLLEHLESEKFYVDTTIQVRDVANRLQQIRSLSII